MHRSTWDSSPGKLFATIFLTVSLSGLRWIHVGSGESARAAVASPVYWAIALVATVASYVGYRAGQRTYH